MFLASGLGEKMKIDPNKKPVNIFKGLVDPFKKKKKPAKVSTPIADNSLPTGIARGQRKRRGAVNEGEQGYCRNGRLLGAIQYLTAVVRQKPELAHMLFRATVAKVLVTRLASQISTASSIVLNNILPTTDPYLLADAIKEYLKAQPNPLIEFDFYEPVIKIVSESQSDAAAAQEIASLFRSEQSGNDTTEIKTLFAFLSELYDMIGQDDAEARKLLPYTLGPVLMWPEFPPQTLEEMKMLKNVPKVVGIIMENYTIIFEPLGNGKAENEPGKIKSATGELAHAEANKETDEAHEQEEARIAAEVAKANAEAAAKAEAENARAAAEAKARVDEATALIAKQAAELEELKQAQASALEKMDDQERASAMIRMEEERAEALARMARLKPQTLSDSIKVSLDLCPDYLTDCRESLNEVRILLPTFSCSTFWNLFYLFYFSCSQCFFIFDFFSLSISFFIHDFGVGEIFARHFA